MKKTKVVTLKDRDEWYTSDPEFSDIDKVQFSLTKEDINSIKRYTKHSIFDDRNVYKLVLHHGGVFACYDNLGEEQRMDRSYIEIVNLFEKSFLFNLCGQTRWNNEVITINLSEEDFY